MEVDPKLSRVISRVGDLPAMPEVVSDVLQITDTPETDMGAVSDRVQRDPALTAKILKISNSPYYGLKQSVGTLKLALVILGVREVRNIVLGISMIDTLRGGSSDPLLSRGFLKHAFNVGGTAKKIGSHLRLEFQGEDFISGLLHDIGKLVLWNCLADEYEAVYMEAESGEVSLVELEREAFGFDHTDAAAALATRWNLPEPLVDAVRMHHGSDRIKLSSATDPLLAAVVRLANIATHLAEQGDESGAGEPTQEELEAWQVLEAAPIKVAEEERRPLLFQIAQELADMPAMSF